MKLLGQHINDNTLQFSLRIGLFLALLGTWEVLAITGVANPFYSSQPSHILKDLPDFYENGKLLQHTGVTLSEALWGLFCGHLHGSHPMWPIKDH